MQNPKIILVDDDVSIIEYLRDLLKSNSYNVVASFNNGIETINYLEKEQADLVLIDISLQAELNGIESSKIIKDKFDTSIIFITGNTSKDVYKKAKAIKPSGYILKPINPEELLKTIDIALNNYENIPSKKITDNYQFKNIIEEVGDRGFNFLRPYLTRKTKKNLVISTTTRFNIINQPEESFNVIINLKKINNIQRMNKFFEAVNFKLADGGYFIGHAETKGLKKKKILSKHPWGINYFFYIIYFIIKRVWPKLPLVKQIYFFITKGRNRSISRAEVLGRLISCGFSIEEEEFIDANLHFIVKKIKEPSFDMHASYDLLIRMRRVGKNGKIINVFKLRTMHPYSEFLQEYIFKLNSLAEGGKIKNDFRISSFGRYARRFWLDELPMLINLIKGDLKLFGVRPLSEHYFNLYPEELRNLRIKFKPGLIPPYYSQYPTPKNMEDIIENELKYLKAYEKNPFITDFKYFWKAFNNIVIKRARSK